MNEMMWRIARAIDQERVAQIEALIERGDTRTAMALTMAEKLRVIGVMMAIREPTDAMREAYRDASFSFSDEWTSRATEAWQTMVDAMGEGD
jgi:hypothetical protein